MYNAMTIVKIPFQLMYYRELKHGQMNGKKKS